LFFIFSFNILVFEGGFEYLVWLIYKEKIERSTFFPSFLFLPFCIRFLSVLVTDEHINIYLCNTYYALRSRLIKLAHFFLGIRIHLKIKWVDSFTVIKPPIVWFLIYFDEKNLKWRLHVYRRVYPDIKER